MSENDVNDTKVPKYKRWNKYVQIIFIGLLLGAGLFGAYAVVRGVMNITEAPVVLSTYEISATYPLTAEADYYNSNMRTELVIYNNAAWDAQSVWIGTDDEYKSYMDGKLFSGDTQHFFKGPFSSAKMIKYKVPLKVDSVDDNDKILSELFKDGKQLLIVIDGEKLHYTITTYGDKEKTVVSVDSV